MSDAFRPITTSRTLQTPQGYRIYTSQREVAAEYPLPAIGAAMSGFLPGFTDHYIMDVTDRPYRAGKIVTVTHGPVPSGTFTEYESVGYRFPMVYPNATTFFPGGSQARPRTVPGRVTYQYALDPDAAGWLDLPAIWDFNPSGVAPAGLASGPFEVKSWMVEAAGVMWDDDFNLGLVGDYLNQGFIGQDTLNDQIYVNGPGSEAHGIVASIPSVTQYAAWVTAGTELMASRVMGKWYCFYMLRSVFVKAQ